MWRALPLALVPGLALASLTPADVSSMGSDITKTIAGGDIVGVKDSDNIEYYFGIPTADDAGGANRFKAPQPKANWGTPITTKVEKMCAGQVMGMDGLLSYFGQEDCIGVDIITPDSTGSPLPVVVYIHGGGFGTQDPSYSRVTNAYYQKTTADESRKVVSVFLHYRLGALGWLAHPALTAETGYSGSGNWGLLDLLNELEWIQNNIAVFGGDPTKVTLTGESAGASLALMLSASPRSYSPTVLFHNVIAQSPFLNYKDGSFGMESRYGMGSMFVSANGCSRGGASDTEVHVLAPGANADAEIACLRGASVPAGHLTANTATNASVAFDAVYGTGASGLVTYNSIQCWPVVDQHVLTAGPLTSWESGCPGGNGCGSDTNFVLGMNADEYSLFYPMPFMEDYATAAYATVDQAYVLAMGHASLTTTTQEWVDLITAAATNTDLMAQIEPFYEDITEDYPKVVQKATDAWFSSNMRLIGGTLRTQVGRTTAGVYKYLFAQDPFESVTHTDTMGGMLSVMGACHGCELTYTMGWYTQNMGYLDYGNTHTVSAAETTMGVTMKKFWLNLAYNGDPGTAPGTSTSWTKLDVDGRHTMVFKASLTSGAQLDVCLDTTTCRVEASNDYRAKTAMFWQHTKTLKYADSLAINDAAMCVKGETGSTQLAMGYAMDCGAFPTTTVYIEPSPEKTNDTLYAISFIAGGSALIIVLVAIGFYATKGGGVPKGREELLKA